MDPNVFFHLFIQKYRGNDISASTFNIFGLPTYITSATVAITYSVKNISVIVEQQSLLINMANVCLMYGKIRPMSPKFNELKYSERIIRTKCMLNMESR